ncbi:MAG: tRNA 4-thiouridine(8) synthase ThiI [Clostridia bacterium]|nr:tRNA 4-thiouridine(8) synthase ThiI [Clostridia bacterium]
MYQVFLVRYGEIGLKGKNRHQFEDKLIRNMEKVLQTNGVQANVEKSYGRIYVPIENNLEQIRDSLERVFGIVSFSPCLRLPLDLEEVKAAALKDMLNYRDKKTFKVETKRAYKGFPHDSYEISREVGGHILMNDPGWTVDVKNPDVIIRVEVREEEIFVFSQVISGPGGMPVGSNGRGLLLLSGGIDSPVAGYLTMKRGVQVEAVHFHSYPFTSERAKEKVIDLCRLLVSYGGKIRLHLVPFTKIQTEIKKHCPQDLGITIMRRMMVRIAEKLARKRRALALVTGESIGQVASQTLESIYTIEHVIKIPVLRPVITMDKTEIIDLAKKIGSYEISIMPYEDCCTVFLPKYPKTRPRPIQAEEAEQGLQLEELVNEAVEKIETLVFGPSN